MTTDIEFTKLADEFMESVFTQLTELDPDELDPDLAMGVLSMEFADGSKCIMNRQTAAHQIWLAEGAEAWHFTRDEGTGDWLENKGRGRVQDVLGEILTRRLGRPITV